MWVACVRDNSIIELELPARSNIGAMNGLRKMESIQQRIQRAEKEKDWAEVADIIDNATRQDVRDLEPLMEEFLIHRHWVVRASAVELIGIFRLHQFTKQVKLRLSDANQVVRTYALSAYYDLLGAKALPTIKRALRSKDTRLRVEALALLYIETKDRDAISQLTRLVTRKRGDFWNREVAFHEFEYYLDLKDHPTNLKGHPEVLNLLESLLTDTPKEHGLAREIRALLAKCRRPGNKGKNAVR
jgi:hypothetical protein